MEAFISMDTVTNRGTTLSTTLSPNRWVEMIVRRILRR
jgi:hypothetical protein